MTDERDTPPGRTVVPPPLCEHARRALERALVAVRAGQPINVIGRAIESEAKRGGFQVIHNLCGHGLGRSLQDTPPRSDGAHARLTRAAEMSANVLKCLTFAIRRLAIRRQARRGAHGGGVPMPRGAGTEFAPTVPVAKIRQR